MVRTAMTPVICVHVCSYLLNVTGDMVLCYSDRGEVDIASYVPYVDYPICALAM